jgi:tRNA1Val (adenine37-N6)-methyltransferase
MKNSKPNTFVFKKFSVCQDKCPMKVNTDGVLLGAWSEVGEASDVLDIGTGTGVIALMLAQKNPALRIDAIDIDDNAARQANENFKNNQLGRNIQVYPMSFQDYITQTNNSYDVIVSNPPFFSNGFLAKDEQRAAGRHTVHLGHDDLISGVRFLLSETGYFDTILPVVEGNKFIRAAHIKGLHLHNLTEVSSREGKLPMRLLLRFSKKISSELKKDAIHIMKANSNDYTRDFIALTQDFYLFM